MSLPASWGEIAAFFGVMTGLFWFLRRLVLAELNSWKAEMLKIIDDRHKEMERQFVSKEHLVLQLQVIAAEQRTVVASIAELKALVRERNNNNEH